MMGDLDAWLREQVAEDRRAVGALVAQQLDSAAQVRASFEIRHAPVQQLVREADRPSEAVLEVLARCEAHERVLARHRRPGPDDLYNGWMYPDACVGCGDTGDPPLEVTDDINRCPELLDMAVAYRRRDGYRTEWGS